jgi:hypothetical protein
MRLLFIALTAFSFPILGHAAIAGDWAGVLAFPRSTMHFVIHVSGPDNSLRATVDSPDQRTAGASVDSIALSGSTLSFTIQYLNVTFSGDVNSNGTIVGTFFQSGTGVPLVLTRTIARAVPTQIVTRPPLSVTGDVFHHDKSGIDFALPDGWSVQGMESATNDPGEMAVLADSSHHAAWASVWMFRTETHPADIQKQLDGSLTRKLASRTGKKTPLPDEAAAAVAYRIRPDSVEHTLVNGQEALRAIGEFKDPAGTPITELMVWISTEHARAYFDLRSQASQFETAKAAFEGLIQSARIP